MAPRASGEGCRAHATCHSGSCGSRTCRSARRRRWRVENAPRARNPRRLLPPTARQLATGAPTRTRNEAESTMSIIMQMRRGVGTWPVPAAMGRTPTTRPARLPSIRLEPAMYRPLSRATSGRRRVGDSLPPRQQSRHPTPSRKRRLVWRSEPQTNSHNGEATRDRGPRRRKS
jgi:hypothetical protein